jgi:hypothetical protein
MCGRAKHALLGCTRAWCAIFCGRCWLRREQLPRLGLLLALICCMPAFPSTCQVGYAAAGCRCTRLSGPVSLASSIVVSFLHLLLLQAFWAER